MWAFNVFSELVGMQRCLEISAQLQKFIVLAVVQAPHGYECCPDRSKLACKAVNAYGQLQRACGEGRSFAAFYAGLQSTRKKSQKGHGCKLTKVGITGQLERGDDDSVLTET